MFTSLFQKDMQLKINNNNNNKDQLTVICISHTLAWKQSKMNIRQMNFVQNKYLMHRKLKLRCEGRERAIS